MLEQREVVVAIVAILFFLFFVINRGKLAAAPYPRFLVISFGLLAASLICSVIEVFVWEDQINLVQHLLATASLIVLATWSWRTFVRGDGVSA